MCGGVAVQIDAMCGGVAMEIDACVEGWRCYGVEGWRCCIMAAWRVLRRGSLEGVVGLWRGGLAGGERENEMRGRESDQVGKWGFGVFFSLNINGRAGGYPPDKKLKTRSPPETRMRKIIISVIRPYMTHGRAAGRTGRAILSGGSVFTGFCPPLLVT
jgi:hypothetical protein